MTANFKINVSIEPHYPLKREQIKKIAEKTLLVSKIKGKVELTIAVIGDRKMRALNKDYRGKDETTDVLSFSFTEGSMPSHPHDARYLYLGEVYVSYPKLLENAAEYNRMVDDELSLLTTHGILHILGYEHEKDPEDKKRMQSLEEDILKSLSV